MGGGAASVARVVRLPALFLIVVSRRAPAVRCPLTSVIVLPVVYRFWLSSDRVVVLRVRASYASVRAALLPVFQLQRPPGGVARGVPGSWVVCVCDRALRFSLRWGFTSVFYVRTLHPSGRFRPSLVFVRPHLSRTGPRVDFLFPDPPVRPGSPRATTAGSARTRWATWPACGATCASVPGGYL